MQAYANASSFLIRYTSTVT